MFYLNSRSLTWTITSIIPGQLCSPIQKGKLARLFGMLLSQVFEAITASFCRTLRNAVFFIDEEIMEFTNLDVCCESDKNNTSPNNLPVRFGSC